MNLYGAPSMTPKEFASYRQQSIVGVSLTVAPPLGQYDSTKLINLGTNRWSFKPEVGISRAYGQWVVEALAGDANYFTGGRTTIGGKQNLDLQRNSRIGATFSSALGRGQAIRMSVSRGAYTTIGADFTSIAVGYNYAWAR
jgi:hypothetical protein